MLFPLCSHIGGRIGEYQLGTAVSIIIWGPEGNLGPACHGDIPNRNPAASEVGGRLPVLLIPVVLLTLCRCLCFTPSPILSLISAEMRSKSGPCLAAISSVHDAQDKTCSPVSCCHCVASQAQGFQLNQSHLLPIGTAVGFVLQGSILFCDTFPAEFGLLFLMKSK